MMNKNEPIIINKAGKGYVVKPLSYVFNDDGDETILAFSNITEMSQFLIEHFETEDGGAHVKTTSIPITIGPKSEEKNSGKRRAKSSRTSKDKK